MRSTTGRGAWVLALALAAALALALVVGSAPVLADEAVVEEETQVQAVEADDGQNVLADDGDKLEAPEADSVEDAADELAPLGASAVEGPTVASEDGPDIRPESQDDPLGMPAEDDSPLGNPYGKYQTYDDGTTHIRCTWYAWEQAYSHGFPLPEANWGNAGDWYYIAPSYEFEVGSTPKANSIACWSANNTPYWGHVAYVTSVNSNGSFNLVEGGSRWPGASADGICSRTVSRGTYWPDLGFIYLTDPTPSTRDIAQATVSSITDQTWTGSAITPSPTVTWSGTTLTNGTDYTLSYSNNVNVGTATVTITGKGGYSGTKTTTFKIVKRDISQATVAPIPDQEYENWQIEPEPTVTMGGTTLRKDVDYTLSYVNNMDVGVATVTITGMGGYTGSTSQAFEIKCDISGDSNWVIVLWPDVSPRMNCTGEPVTPKPTLLLERRGGDYPRLELGTDYMLSYRDNVNPGTATVVVTGKGFYYGSVELAFDIVENDGPLGSIASGVWGTCPWEISPDGTLTVHPGKGADQGGGWWSPWDDYAFCVSSIVFSEEGGRKAIAPEDSSHLLYDLYNVVSVDASGLDTSSVKDMRGFFCQPSYGMVTPPLASIDFSGWVTSQVTDMGVMFDGCRSLTTLDISGWDTSSVETMDGMFDYCTALSSIDLSSWETSNVVNMSGMFEGCRSLTSLDLSGWDTSSVGYASYMFFGCRSISALDLSSWDTSSLANMQAMFRNCSSLETILVGDGWSIAGVISEEYGTDVFRGCESVIGGNGTVFDPEHTDIEYARVDGEEGPGYLTRTTNLSGATISVLNQTYTGKPLTPEITVMLGEDTLSEGVDFTVAFSDNVNPGTARVTVTGVGRFTGTAVASFAIEPALIPIYRMYNTKTSEHLWTKSKAEYNACGSGNYKDWRQENVAWYSPNLLTPASYAASTQGNYVYVYRLYDKGRTGDHIYLTYGAEMKSYLSNGWVVDKGAGFWTLRKGAKVAGKTIIPIYRAYNPKLKRGKHHYTPSKTEYDTICKKHGWKPEDVKFYVVKK